MTQMKTAVISQVNGPWVLEDRPVPEAGPNDVLVQIHASGICGADVWISNGTLSFKEFPLILGHESVGEVVGVGSSVTSRKVGDRVGIPMHQEDVRCVRFLP
ncbi:alcohol dehydrogenase catalytic domain-containing protein [Amycolatopsis sp. NPDC049253]|uniref:alcohol dehydrogenase catalytic domain-containing protein n=1 Tax=Amycolatopsis sp. NPDC049253 TaxID=3155274 RepID=UPI0034325DF2